MRRRRKPLEVSTFPFLAVLLCAMGSLILILVVMDRKAKQAARHKAEVAIAHAADQAEQDAAARRAELQRLLQAKRAEKQAEWEKKREALHTKLLTEQQALQLEMQQLRDKMTMAAARLRMEQEQSGDLKKQVETERDKVQGETDVLATKKQAVADTENHTEQEKAALARMTNDLVVLERALQDLKEARERERQTYSVVPYNGKRGESRRPLYVECVGHGVIFHPDKKTMPVIPEAVRTEVARRVVAQRAQLAAAKMPIDQTPYLMLLVRPDGVTSYYQFEAALAGLDVQFGYELIDADWLLDFPADYQPGSQPWQTLAKQPDLPPLDPAPGAAKIHGVHLGNHLASVQTLGAASEGGMVARTRLGGTAGEGNGGSAMRSDNGLSSTGIGRPVVVGDGSAATGGSGTGEPNNAPISRTMPWEIIASGFPLPKPGQGHPGTKGESGWPANPFRGPDDPSVPVSGGDENQRSVGGMRGDYNTVIPLPPLPQSLAQANPSPGSPSGGRSNGANVSPGVQPSVPPSGITPNPGTPPNGSPLGTSANSGAPPGGPPTGTNASPGKPSGGPSTGASGRVASGPPSDPAAGMPPLPPPGTPSTSATDGSNPPSGQRPSAGGAMANGTPSGNGSSSGEGGEVGEAPWQSVLRPQPPPNPEAKRPLPPIRMAKLNGDRNYLIFIECKADSVVLYPSQREFPVATLVAGPNNPLVQTVQQMVERKQLGVQAGETPFRPQVRFLVRPDTLRTYFTAYPLFESLPLAMTRYNLTPEDDLRKIISGN